MKSLAIRSIPPRSTAFVLALLMVLFSLPAAHAQSANVTVDINLINPPPTCNFTVQGNLNFGTAEKPGSGNGSVTISQINGNRTSSNTTVSGSSSVGQVRLAGSNVASYTVTRTFPSSLTRSGGGSLTFSGTWAQSASQSSGYSNISGSSYNGTAGGVGTSFTRYFRYGGTAGGINLSDPNGNYDNNISVSGSCS